MDLIILDNRLGCIFWNGTLIVVLEVLWVMTLWSSGFFIHLVDKKECVSYLLSSFLS